jgi:hypothetical protein
MAGLQSTLSSCGTRPNPVPAAHKVKIYRVLRRVGGGDVGGSALAPGTVG